MILEIMKTETKKYSELERRLDRLTTKGHERIVMELSSKEEQMKMGLLLSLEEEFTLGSQPGMWAAEEVALKKLQEIPEKTAFALLEKVSLQTL